MFHSLRTDSRPPAIVQTAATHATVLEAIQHLPKHGGCLHRCWAWVDGYGILRRAAAYCCTRHLQCQRSDVQYAQQGTQHSQNRVGRRCTYGGPCIIAMGRGIPYCPRQQAGGPETVQCLRDKGLNPMSSAASSSCRFGNTHVRSWMNCTSQSNLQGRSHNGAASNGHLSAASPLPAVGLACKSAR